MIGFTIFIIVAIFILFILPVKAWRKGRKLQSIIYSFIGLISLVTIYVGIFESHEQEGHLYGYAIIMMPFIAITFQFFIGFLFKVYRLIYAAIAINKRNSSCL